MSDASTRPHNAPQPPLSPDRNLLFGVLALQLEFIDDRQFAQACSAWAARKDDPLADVLQELGWLSDDDRREVERLLERKLKRHGGDVRAGLAEVTTDGVKHSLASIADADLVQHVREMLGATPPVAPGWVLLSTTAATPESRDRYTLTRLHGEGGLGQVWVARDNDLGRDVAFKQIRPERAAHPEMWRRFLKEARITGQLEHPNIVPVYELGRGEEGQPPFYTMRLVRGQTLREAIAEYHKRRQAGAEDPLARPKLLQAFVSVCQALNYAHSHGVIHRDLKPDNVILGRFGEVVVLDWGLAKVVDQAEENATRIGTDDEARPGLTQAGQALGTPAYMAPEQAEGRLDLIDRRTDIYGLGAILFEILTGRAPHRGPGTAELLRRIAQGPTPLARSAEPSAPPALEAVCARAMARAPADRYDSAAALAEDVQRWLADEPVSAYREPLRVRLGRKLRRYRSVVAGAAVVLLSVATVASVLAWRIYREKNRAEAAEQVAVQQTDVAVDAIGELLLEMQLELDDTPGAYVARTNIIKLAMNRIGQLSNTPATSDRVFRRHIIAHMQLADLHWELAERPQAHEEYLIAYDLAKRAFEANPASDKAKSNVQSMGTKLAESELYFRANCDRAEELYAASVKGWEELAEKMRQYPDGDPNLPPAERMSLYEIERSLADAYDHLSKVYAFDKCLAKWDLAKSVEFVNKGLAIRERLVAVKPTLDMRQRLAVSYLYLADVAFKRNDMAGCIRNNEELVKQRQALLKERPTSLRTKHYLSDSEFRLGDAVIYLGQRERALELYTDGLKWAEQVRWAEPESPWYRGSVAQGHYCIASALPKSEKDKALAHWREALKIREELYKEVEEKKITRTQDKMTLCLTLARCGEHGRAAAIADELRKVSDPRELTEEVAATYALCMAAVQDDRPLDQLPPEERKLRDHYRDLALATMKEGTAKGYHGYVFMEGDPDYEPLRALPEFQEWLAEFKKGLKPN
jgi:tRNA A-37 threonylcarbamoyl transferase component Bud32